jgi:hypothetical protein
VTTSAGEWLAARVDSSAIRFGTYRAHRVVMRSIVEASADDDEFRQRFEEMMTVFVSAIGGHIRRGQATGAVTLGRRGRTVAAST